MQYFKLLTCADGRVDQVPDPVCTVDLALAHALVVAVADVLVHRPAEVFHGNLPAVGQVRQLAEVTLPDSCNMSMFSSHSIILYYLISDIILN